MSLSPTTRSEATPNGNAFAHPAKVAPQPIDELNREGQRIQELIERADSLPDAAARALVQECVQALLAFQGRGLARIVELVQGAGPEGEMVFDQLANDPIVRGLLLIHGLHPADLETRLREALKKVRPYMESHGGNVELVSLEGDVARLRLQGACKGCPSSAITMELALRRAIEEACPDLIGLEVEGVATPSGPVEIASDRLRCISEPAKPEPG
jgi:Fe-S cluster biogenesis protein NfuA